MEEIALPERNAEKWAERNSISATSLKSKQHIATSSLEVYGYCVLGVSVSDNYAMKQLRISGV